VCAKRLEKGRFHWPETSGEETKVVLSHEELALLLGGIDLSGTQRRQWYRCDMTPGINTQIFA
jgi:transposase